LRVCLIASRLAVNPIFLRHPPRTKKIITSQIDHAFANYDGLGRQILKKRPHPFVPNTLARTPIWQVAL